MSRWSENGIEVVRIRLMDEIIFNISVFAEEEQLVWNLDGQRPFIILWGFRQILGMYTLGLCILLCRGKYHFSSYNNPAA